MPISALNAPTYGPEILARVVILENVCVGGRGVAIRVFYVEGVQGGKVGPGQGKSRSWEPSLGLIHG